MRFTIEAATFAKGLSAVAAVIQKANKTTLPILTNVLITASKDGRVGLLGTNMDQQSEAFRAAEVHVPGEIAADAHALLSVVNRMVGDVEVEIGRAHV